MGDYPNLRDWEPGDKSAEFVEDTRMLNTQAKEAADTVTCDNDNKELVNKTPSFGDLGARGRN